MTEIKTLSWTELEMLVNDLKKKHTNKGLTDVETKILKGVFDDKTYRDLAEEIRTEEQSIKNAASSLFKILSAQTGEKIGKSNLITALSRCTLQPECNQKNTNYDGKFSGAVVFTASENKKKQILTILELLRKITDDQEITITDIEQGSIKLTLKGSQKSLEKIESLFKSGDLNKISGDITVENVQFTEDNCLAFTIAGDVNADEITYLKSTIIGQNLAESPKQLAEESSANPLIVKTVSTNEASKEINNKLIESIKKPNFPQRIIRRFGRIHLKEANLSGADLIEADLRKADLSGADLSGADLSGAKLSEAILSGAYLSEAILIEAILSEADLRGAYLRGAILREADLSGADLRRADLREADLSGADLRGAILSWAILSGADLSWAILSGADLSKANLRGAILWGANLRGAILWGANLSGANLRGAFLSGADLSKANLRGAILWGANLSGANLSGANLSAAILIEANLSGANLSGAKLRGAILIEADLSGANLKEAILSGADLSGADLRRANLSDANLSGANLKEAILSAAEVKKAIFIGATGITREQKQDLIRRGAIFGDNSNDRSKVLV
ncbi:MAG: pentapeptide repeat-containing protein [Microcystis sp. M049S2]|uniref:pentapeptide repeat-containing protein n=1 Tax=Microcystis sp. M049S2 TaxID=2771169 RepID=UPI00258C6D00|nr:pentapeptide repeat-containing protein [Microcystis sp. M049S2]MCA2657522.1 pentapeptide repeat-containing protein [Microcystis sp. M049S2]